MQNPYQQKRLSSQNLILTPLTSTSCLYIVTYVKVKNVVSFTYEFTILVMECFAMSEMKYNNIPQHTLSGYF